MTCSKGRCIPMNERKKRGPDLERVPGGKREKQVACFVPYEDWHDMKVAAAMGDVTVSAIIRRAIKQELARMRTSGVI